MSEEQLTPAQPDRMPTPDEERAAEQAAADVDVDEVGEHYQDMAQKGADVRGEGEIEPDRD